MKKLLIMITIILFLTSCTKLDKTTTNDEPTLSKVEFKTNHENNFIEPGETIIFTINETTDGDKDNTTIKDGYSVEIDNENVAKVNNDRSVTISKSTLSGTELNVTVKYKEDSFSKNYIIRKSLAHTIDKNGVVTNPADYDLLVNKQRTLPSDYVPDDLVKLQVQTQLPNPEINQLRKIASDALTNLFNEGKKEGFRLVARSGYRSYATQNALYNGNVASKGKIYANKYSAQPGKSEHQTGLSIDITSENVDYQLSSDFGETPEGKWVIENANKYGFIIRYPKGKETIVGYEYEPWHLRYLGVELATKIYKSGLTMEEYFEQP